MLQRSKPPARRQSKNRRQQTSQQVQSSLNIFQQQRTILTQAIDSYLTWRGDKSQTRGRNYPVTLSTYLHHLTKFGEHRANRLKTRLTPTSTTHPIAVLQEHLNAHSKMGNFSLDTYLIEALFAHKALFLIPNTYAMPDSEVTRTALRSFILAQQAYTHQEYTYQIGQLYQADTQIPNHLQHACAYYAIGLAENHKTSIVALRTLASNGQAQAQYLLGFRYYHRRKNMPQAINWCLLAAEQGHQEATVYLQQTIFDVAHYLYLAKRYEQGDNVTRNITTALLFYEKAYALNNPQAALRLGELYAAGINHTASSSNQTISQGLAKNSRQAFEYYATAATQGHKTALTAMVKIAEDINDDDLRFRVSAFYLNVFAEPLTALRHLKTLADKNIKAAIDKLAELTQSHSEYSYIVGSLYEQDANHQQQALDYYTQALHQDNVNAKMAMGRLAAQDNADAAYRLAIDWYHRKGQIDEAIKGCMQAAEQQHALAHDYLLKTPFTAAQYLMMAQAYEHGDGVNPDTSLSHHFYEKACEQNSIPAALYLGQRHESNELSARGDISTPYLYSPEKAFDYYVIAAEQGDQNALDAMIRLLAQHPSDLWHVKLACVYLTGFNHAESALTHLKPLADKGYEPAISQLHNIAIVNAEFAYRLADRWTTDSAKEDHIQQAGYYYLLAIQQGYQAAHQAFETMINTPTVRMHDLNELGKLCLQGQRHVHSHFILAKQCFDLVSQRTCQPDESDGHGEAYYHLGIIFAEGLGVDIEPVTAVNYFRLAENRGFIEASGRLQALISTGRLTPQQLMAIASLYLNEPGDAQIHWPYILNCYEAASHLGDKTATKWLAEFYQLAHTGLPQDNTKAFQYYLRLVELRDADAFAPLERLADEASAEQQYALSQRYASFFNQERASYWHARATEVQQLTLYL